MVGHKENINVDKDLSLSDGQKYFYEYQVPLDGSIRPFYHYIWLRLQWWFSLYGY